jgi:hypothetical protein
MALALESWFYYGGRRNKETNIFWEPFFTALNPGGPGEEAAAFTPP